MTRTLIACLLMMSAHAWAQETNTVLRVPLAQLEQIWTEHVAAGMDDPHQTTASREWFCRSRLRQQPDNIRALEILTRQWIQSDDLTLAAAALPYAQSLGSTNLSHDLVAILTNHAARIIQSEQNEPFIQTRVEMIKEDLLKTRAYLNLEEFTVFETRLRTIIRQSNDRKEAITTLIQLYELQQDPLLPTLLARLCLAYDAKDSLMIERYIQGLQALGKEALVTEFLRSYATRRGLDRELNQLMGSLCLARGRKDLAYLFINRWSMQAPDDPLAWQLLGQVQAEKRKDDQAMRSLLKAAKLPGHSPEVYRQIARVAERKGKLSTMAFWLSRWRLEVGDDALLELLQSPPFNRHPGLLKEIQ